MFVVQALACRKAAISPALRDGLKPGLRTKELRVSSNVCLLPAFRQYSCCFQQVSSSRRIIAKFLLLCLFGILTLNTFGAESVVISEFMARNETGLRDEDGAFSDWIELHNSGSAPVNLDGWYLTDTTNNLTKWRIPATNILAGGYLVIFASGKDRATPGAPLHTSFNLSGSGEYLALVRPDGVTIASEYAPLFPEQFDDISYGIGQNATATKLIAAGARAKVLVPQDGLLGTNWTAIAFDDGTWQSG